MSQPSWIEQVLNRRYQIKTLLGQGGLSTTYQPNDPNLMRNFSIIKQTSEGVSQFFAIVVNPDHNIIPGSSNCFDLLTE